MHRIIVAITCLISLSLRAEAQTPDNLLRGLSQIHLTIENLDDNDTACGLTKALIRNAVLYPASFTKFQITDARTSPVGLYVNVVSLFFKSDYLCVTHITMQAYSNQTLTLDFSHREAFAAVELWNKGSIVSTDRAEHAHHVTQSIDELVRQFITDWNFDNKDEN
jgi:hypothetical protein